MGKIVSYEELGPRFGVTYSKAHLWRLEKAGKWPKRVNLAGPGSRYGWTEEELRAHLEAVAAERDSAA